MYLIGGTFRELPTSQLYNALNARHTSVGFSIITNNHNNNNKSSTTILRPYTSSLPLQVLLGLHTQILNYSYESAVESSSSVTLPSSLTNNTNESPVNNDEDDGGMDQNYNQHHYFHYDNNQKIVASQASDVLAAYAYRLHSLSSLSTTVSSHYASYLATSTCSCGNMHISIAPLPSIVHAFTYPIIQNGKPFVPIARTALTLTFKHNTNNHDAAKMGTNEVPTTVQDVMMGPVITSAVDANAVQTDQYTTHDSHKSNGPNNNSGGSSTRVSIRSMHCGHCQDSPVLIMEVIGGPSNNGTDVLYAVDSTRLDYTARYIVAKKEKEEYLQTMMYSGASTTTPETVVIVLHPWDGKHIDTVCSLRDIASLVAIIDSNTNALGIMPLSNDLKPSHWINNAPSSTRTGIDEGNGRKQQSSMHNNNNKGITRGGGGHGKAVNGTTGSNSYLATATSVSPTKAHGTDGSNSSGIPLPNRQAFSPESPQISRSSLNQGNNNNAVVSQPNGAVSSLPTLHHGTQSTGNEVTNNSSTTNNNSIFGPSGGSPGEENKYNIPNLQNMSPSMQAAIALAAGRLSLSNAGAEQRRRLHHRGRSGPSNITNGPQISLVPGRQSRDPHSIFQAYGGAPVVISAFHNNHFSHPTEPTIIVGNTAVPTITESLSMDTATSGTVVSSQNSTVSVSTANDSIHIPSSVPSSVTAATISQSNNSVTTNQHSIFNNNNINNNRRLFDLTSVPITYGSSNIPPPALIPRPSSSLSTSTSIPSSSPLQFVANHSNSWAEMNVAGSRAQANHTVATYLSNKDTSSGDYVGTNDFSGSNIVRPSFGPAKANVSWTVSRLGGDWRWNNFGPWNGGPSSFGAPNTMEDNDHYSHPNVSPAPVAALRFDTAPTVHTTQIPSFPIHQQSSANHMVARPPSRGRPVVVDSGPSPSLPPLALTNTVNTSSNSNVIHPPHHHQHHPARSSVSFAPVPVILQTNENYPSSQSSNGSDLSTGHKDPTLPKQPRNESFITVNRGSSARNIVPPVELQMSNQDESAEDSWFLETAGQPPMEALIISSDPSRANSHYDNDDTASVERSTGISLISPQESPMKGYMAPIDGPLVPVPSSTASMVLSQSSTVNPNTTATTNSNVEFGRIARKKATPIPQKRAPNGSGIINNSNNIINPALISLLSNNTEETMNLSAITLNSASSPDRKNKYSNVVVPRNPTLTNNRTNTNGSSLSPTKKGTGSSNSSSNGSNKSSSNSPPNAGPVPAARRAAAAVQSIR